MSYPQSPDQPHSYPPPPPPGASQYQGGGSSPSGGYDSGGYDSGGYYGGSQPAPSRPGTLVAGCILSWIGSVVGALFGLLFLALSGTDQLLDELPDEINRDDAQASLQVIGGILLVWSLLTLIFAVLAFMGRRWAAIALTVLGVLWILLSALSVAVGNAPGVLSILWVGAAVLLVMMGSKRWFDYKSGKNRGAY